MSGNSNMRRFFNFKDRSLKIKILVMYIVSLSIIGVAGYSYYIYSNIKIIQKGSDIYRDNLLKTDKQSAINAVNIAIRNINNFYQDYKDGKIDENNAKKKSIRVVYSIRYNIGENLSNYVWINTANGIMVAEPTKPDLNGKNVWNFKDKNGVYLFRNMASVVKTREYGFVKYCWPKLGLPENTCFPKTSYVKLFYPWNWIVGSGFYLDNINKEVASYIKRRKSEIFHTIILSIIFGGIFSLIAGLFFFFVISKMVSYLKQVAELSRNFLYEDVSEKLKLPYKTKDELGYLIRNFNAFIEESYKLASFKKTVEEDRDIDAVYERIKNIAETELGFEEFNMYEVNNSKNSLKQVIAPDGKMFCKQDILVDSDLCRAVRTANDINSFEKENVCLSFAYEKDKNYVCIPLMISGSVGGIAQVVFDKNIKYEDVDGKIKRLKRYLKEVAPVVEAKRLLSQLKETTMKDPLTGLYNRRFLDEFASTFAASVKRRGAKAGILMCDIDFFKQVNDVYGHNIGDEVLKAITRSISKSIREADIAIRFGGEEFLILLQDADNEKAKEISERIRQTVEASEIVASSNVIKKTISIGISIFPEDAENLWKCIKYSDVAMYKAKTTGRNKVVRFESSMWESDEY